MEARVIALEDFAIETRDRLARIETRLGTFVTKADLHQELHSMTWKLLGGAMSGASALVGIVYWIARNSHSYHCTALATNASASFTTITASR